MPVQTVNQTNTPQQKSKKPVIIASSLLGGAATGAATYFLAPSKISADKILGLSDDKFEKIFEKVPEKKEPYVDLIYEMKDGIENIDKYISADTAGIFKEEEELPVEKFFEAIHDGEGDLPTLESIKTETKKLDTEIVELETKYKDAKNMFKNATNETAGEAEQSMLNLYSSILGKKSKCEYGKGLAEALDGAKNGIITADAFKIAVKPKMQEQAKGMLGEAMELLGDSLPKVKSLPKAAVFGAVATVVIGGLSALLTGPKKTEKPAEPKA